MEKEIKIGLKFIDGIRSYEVINILTINNVTYYQLKNYTDNRENELMKKEQIEKYILNQEEYVKRYYKSLAYEEKVRKEKEKQKIQEKKFKESYEFCHGYCDDKTPMQKGKILKVINKKILWDNEDRSRKEVIDILLKENNINIYQNSKGKWILKTERYIYDLTVTEKKYIDYLLNK